uniref:Gamma-interferon-inducible lysosomal thiol reductase n=1 Tax=Timema tahoe TaxID=61484 RepID=A0A7R9NX13_9NEOP|nr:unnamed protein product [Timema tahoe]
MLALLLLTTLIAPSFQDQVNVTLFYESLCPYSIRFITQQLYPTWTELTSEYLAVDFVPYGNAQQTLSADGQWSFTCQHGPNECVGNIVQACALRTLRDQPDQQMEFINCVMDSEDPSTGGQEVSRTGQEVSGTGGHEASRTGGQEVSRTVGQEVRRTGG